ncbi:MAG: roadblock/LC7 domain-containing protein [Deinococcus sp.]|uniref:roadblock/LC7 domain-containing protein n=1 Tax=Deinococcus sp. TaxID=47478 RepID=UPI0026DBB2DA|nr:roadblock/LC7 domain-containing protein [Deinococcus sp.]MDO4245180.1 roadblock/LC7 domain-containing protein [Deinococcus sp.]
MTRPTLTPLLDVRGVQGAALIGVNGRVEAAVGDGDISLSMISAARAVLQSLQAATGVDTWNDLLLDLEGGPLLLTPYGDSVLAVHFDEVPALGRVRLGVRRVLS